MPIVINLLDTTPTILPTICIDKKLAQFTTAYIDTADSRNTIDTGGYAPLVKYYRSNSHCNYSAIFAHNRFDRISRVRLRMRDIVW